MEEIELLGENHPPAASHLQTSPHYVVPEALIAFQIPYDHDPIFFYLLFLKYPVMKTNTEQENIMFELEIK